MVKRSRKTMQALGRIYQRLGDVQMSRTDISGMDIGFKHKKLIDIDWCLGLDYLD